MDYSFGARSPELYKVTTIICHSIFQGIWVSESVQLCNVTRVLWLHVTLLYRRSVPILKFNLHSLTPHILSDIGYDLPRVHNNVLEVNIHLCHRWFWGNSTLVEHKSTPVTLPEYFCARGSNNEQFSDV